MKRNGVRSLVVLLAGDPTLLAVKVTTDYSHSVDFSQYKTYSWLIGTLVVDIFDAPTKKLIWRGMATDVLSDKLEKNIKKLQKTVEEMFEHFPPKAQ